MRAPAESRRPVYFAFQGLFMAVLLLLFLYQGRQHEGWAMQFAVLTAGLFGSLALIRTVPEAALTRGWFQAGLFVGDALAATLTLNWIQPRSELYLVYFLIVFGSALTRSPRQSLVVGAVTVILYTLVWWRPGAPLPASFWLRIMFLTTSSALLAILARDAQRAQAEEKRRYDERLIQVERLATLGQVAGEVAHRIKGPLTTIAVNAEVLAHRHAKSKETLTDLSQIIEEVGRCKEILKNLLDLGRIEEMDSEPLDLRVPVERALRSLEPQARIKGAVLDCASMPRALKARGDLSLLQEAMSALMQNAVEAVDENGRIRVEVRTVAGRHRVSVHDDGAGVPAEKLERVFQPFFTTKPQGSGLGLSAALRIAEKHGGTIELESSGAGRGSRFTFILPEA